MVLDPTLLEASRKEWEEKTSEAMMLMKDKCMVQSGGDKEEAF